MTNVLVIQGRLFKRKKNCLCRNNRGPHQVAPLQKLASVIVIDEIKKILPPKKNKIL